MSDQSGSGRNGEPAASRSTMIKWLGFFLLVFAVAGFAFYLTGDSKDVTGSIDPGGRKAKRAIKTVGAPRRPDRPSAARVT